MNEILNVDLIGVYQKLRNFAEHHFRRGITSATGTIGLMQTERQTDKNPRDGSPEGLAFDRGYDKALGDIKKRIEYEHLAI